MSYFVGGGNFRNGGNLAAADAAKGVSSQGSSRHRRYPPPAASSPHLTEYSCFETSIPANTDWCHPPEAVDDGGRDPERTTRWSGPGSCRCRPR